MPNNNNNSGTTNMDFDPFKVLELNPCGDINQIKAAFHRLSRRTHPDMAARSEQNIPGDPDYFSRIKKAYDFLRALDAKALAEYAFIKLAESGDAAQMRSLLRTLHLDAVELKRLLSAGLFNAAKNGHIKMARLLLKRGADQRETGTVTVDGQMITATWIYGFFGWAPSDQQDIKQIVCAACYAGHLDIERKASAERKRKASAERKRKASAERKRKASAGRNSDGGGSSSSSSSSSKPPRGNADPLYGVVFIIGVIFLALANYYLPAPVCAALLFTAIFAFYNYRSKLYNLLPEQFFDVITDTHALYMEKLKRLFPDRQEMPFGIGAPYNSVKQTLTQMSESNLLKWTPGCGNMPNTARKILKMLSPICPALLNDVGRVFVGAVLIFAVGSLFVYDLKVVVSTYILLIFVAFFVKFGVDDIKRRQ